MSQVILQPAFCWECPKCVHTNFVEAPIGELTDEDRADIAEQTGREPHEVQTGNWRAAPDRVTCEACHTEFEVDAEESSLV